MKVVIDIPKDFTGDYIADKFKDFFSRVIADIDCKSNNADTDIAFSALITFINELAEQLKAGGENEESI